MMKFELGLDKPDPARGRMSAVTIAGSYITVPQDRSSSGRAPVRWRLSSGGCGGDGPEASRAVTTARASSGAMVARWCTQFLGLVVDPELAPAATFLRPDRPLVGPSDHRECELALPQRRDHQPTPPVGGICLRVARRTERDQAVQVEVRAALGALDDVIIVSPEQIFESR